MYAIVYDKNYLKHHGVLGQKHGVRNGPPYPLDYNKLAKDAAKAGYDRDEVISQAKINAIRRGDLEEVNKNRDYFTDQEVNAAIDRFNLNGKLSSLDRHPDRFEKGLAKAEELANKAVRVTDIVDKGSKAWDSFAKIANAAKLTNEPLPIINDMKYLKERAEAASATIKQLRDVNNYMNSINNQNGGSHNQNNGQHNQSHQSTRQLLREQRQQLRQQAALSRQEQRFQAREQQRQQAAQARQQQREQSAQARQQAAQARQQSAQAREQQRQQAAQARQQQREQAAQARQQQREQAAQARAQERERARQQRIMVANNDAYLAAMERDRRAAENERRRIERQHSSAQRDFERTFDRNQRDLQSNGQTYAQTQNNTPVYAATSAMQQIINQGQTYVNRANRI